MKLLAQMAKFRQIWSHWKHLTKETFQKPDVVTIERPNNMVTNEYKIYNTLTNYK